MKARFKLSVLAVLALLAGCKGEDAVEEPVDFTQATYTLYNGGQVSVGLAVVNPVSQNLTIPLEIEGPASDVTIIPQEITIPAGEISGGTVITDKSLTEGARLILSVNPPQGYMGGKRGTTTVIYDPREALDCSIPGTEYSFTEGMELAVVLTGARSNADFKAEAEDAERVKAKGLILYEPDSETVFDAIVPQYLAALISGAMFESVASELAARRTAMDAATKNQHPENREKRQITA